MRTFPFILLFLFPFLGNGQNASAGSGNCLTYDGVDDYITVTGGAAHNYALPFTISAWVKIDPSATGEIPIFSSNDQSNVNAGLHFWLTDTSINAGYCNGSAGAFLPNTFYRQFVSSNIKGMWINVAAVINTNSISLFLNGVQLGGQLYNPNVSYLSSNVGTSVIGKKTNGVSSSYYDGQIDEISLLDGALTPVEIRNNMCRKLNPVPSNVFRYFKLDALNGTSIIDDSQFNTSAQINSSPVLVKSGAAIGDASTYTYQNGSWGGYTHSFGSLGGNNYSVSNVQSNPDGLQMYLVESVPNTLDTLDWVCAEDAYLGVFICRQSIQNYDYNFQFSFNGNTSVNNFIPIASDLSLKTRNDNSENWSTQVAVAPANRTFNLQQQTTRQEYVLSGVHTATVIDIPDTITCADSIVLSAPFNSVYFYNWSNGSSTYQSSYTQAGLHWVEYGDTCGNSVVTDTFQLTLGFSNLTIGKDTTLCFGDSLVLSTNLNFANHLWQDGSSNTTLTVKQPGKYWVEVNFGPCYGTDTINVDFDNTIPFSLGPDTSFCFGDSILLDATSSNANTFIWNTTETTPSIWVSKSGAYMVTAGSNGCFQSSGINIEVYLDDVTFAEDTLLCRGQNGVLWASGGNSYLWSTGSTNDTISVTPNTSTNYSVTVTEGNCSIEHFIQVDVTDRIAIADFTYEINSCKGSISLKNQSTNADIYFWDFGDGATSTRENPEHIYQQGGTYTIKLVASKNSCPDTLTQVIQVISLKNIVYFPDAFTPNADGINDFYQVKGSSDCFTEPNLIIQNRWGNEIFNSTSPFIEFWDGRLNGKIAPQGVYFYSFYSHNYIVQGKFTLIQ